MLDDGLSQKLATVAGAGISINSLRRMHYEITQGSLVHALPDYKVADRVALWLVYPKSRVMTAKVRTFIDFLLEKSASNRLGTGPDCDCWGRPNELAPFNARNDDFGTRIRASCADKSLQSASTAGRPRHGTIVQLSLDSDVRRCR